MRLARFMAGGRARVGLVQGEELFEVLGGWRDALRRSAGRSPSRPLPLSGRRWSIADCLFLPPLPQGSRGLFCVGMNYAEHQAEAGTALAASGRSRPIFFMKTAAAMAPPYSDLSLDPEVSPEFDWEVELGVVIGRAGANLTPDRVVDHLAGYTVVNDVTARDLQRLHEQWFIGKNIVHSSPMGPWVTTIDEAGYPPRFSLRLLVNGKEKQNAKTDQMIHDVAEQVCLVSRYLPLEVGDVFATGTPSGVGFTRQPPQFLRPGDTVEAEIEGVGSLVNRVVG